MEVDGPGADAADFLDGDPLVFKVILQFADLFLDSLRFPFPKNCILFVGQVPGVGLDAFENQVRRIEEMTRKRGDFFLGFDAAAVHADVILYQAAELRSLLFAGSLERVDIVRVIHTDRQVTVPCEDREAGDLGRRGDLVRDQDVLDAGKDQVLRFGELGTADSLCAVFQLQLRDGGTLVGFIMGTEPDGSSFQQPVHGPHIFFHNIKVDDQGGRLQLFHSHGFLLSEAVS